ncbi:MAG: 3-oxoacyl-[acyl-carrier-protein] synthase III C-terminal domain-containing protein [Planctomycetaceae bacterium]
MFGLASIVDVYDRDDLYDFLDNARIVELSRLGGAAGFASPENVSRSTGISVRRILRPGVTAVDVGVALGRRLEQESGQLLHEFPLIMLCHSNTDPSACERLAVDLSERFGIPAGRLLAFNFGCSGFLKLLHEAMIHLVGDDNLSRIVLLNIETPETWHDSSDRLFCGIVAAGATAMVLERGRGLPVSTVRSEDFPIPDQLRPNPDPLFRRDTTDGFCFRGQPIHRTVMRMNAEPVFLNGIELMLAGLRTAASLVEVLPGQRVIVVPHQPSGKLLKALVAAARVEFPDFEYLNNLKTYGNTISSSVPTILSRLPQVLEANGLQPPREGDHIILLAAGICMEEISDHMSAGHACLQWVTVSNRETQVEEAVLAHGSVPVV